MIGRNCDFYTELCGQKIIIFAKNISHEAHSIHHPRHLLNPHRRDSRRGQRHSKCGVPRRLQRQSAGNLSTGERAEDRRRYRQTRRHPLRK